MNFALHPHSSFSSLNLCALCQRRLPRFCWGGEILLLPVPSFLATAHGPEATFLRSFALCIRSLSQERCTSPSPSIASALFLKTPGVGGLPRSRRGGGTSASTSHKSPITSHVALTPFLAAVSALFFFSRTQANPATLLESVPCALFPKNRGVGTSPRTLGSVACPCGPSTITYLESTLVKAIIYLTQYGVPATV